jgi:hypothetical protein
VEEDGGAQQGVQQHAAMGLQLRPPYQLEKLLLLFTFLSISQSVGGGWCWGCHNDPSRILKGAGGKSSRIKTDGHQGS